MNSRSRISSVEALWAAFHQNPCDRTRNGLMEHYLPMVRFAALRQAARNGRRAQAEEVEDLMQFGVFGLRDAIRGFDPGRGVKFETYALQRVRGAMLDGLKTNQWVPREIRQQVNRYYAVEEGLQGECGAGVHVDAAAARMGLAREDLVKLQGHAGRMMVGSLHAEEAQLESDDTPRCNTVPDHREEEASVAQQRQDVRDLLLKELTRTERHLMMLYYYENLSMREVGAVLGISGTRVSQMHSDIVCRLRERFGSRVLDRTGQAHPVQHI